jgi:hypothetical protein
MFISLNKWSDPIANKYGLTNARFSLGAQRNISKLLLEVVDVFFAV